MPAGILERHGRTIGPAPQRELPVAHGARQDLAPADLVLPGRRIPSVEGKRPRVIGVLTDFFVKTIAEVKSPFDGVVMYVVGTPAMNKGEPVGMVAARTTAPR